MRRLIIDCATEACSVALFHNDDLIAHDHRELGRGHAERLIPMIADFPDRGFADEILVSRGPGSFTGVRIGIAAARALALAWSAHLRGYPTLSLITAMARHTIGPDPVIACMRGGHGEWFVQHFDADGTASSPHSSLTPDIAIKSSDTTYVAGNMAEDFVSQRGFGHAIPLLPDAQYAPHLPQSALSHQTSPIYGRAPDAKPAAS